MSSDCRVRRWCRRPPPLVVGDRDQPDILAIADLLEERIPDAQKVMIPGVAHMVNMERPAEFNRVVLAFLAEALGSPRGRA